jgi:DNA replication ATP-dependent helicase Dna2
MATTSPIYRPACAVCGPRQRCDQPWIEGMVTRVERHLYAGRQGEINGVHLRLNTSDGACLLVLGDRFAYLAAGLAEAPEGLTIRAYHLRHGRATAGPDESRSVPRFVTDRESLVVLEPDWLVDVTALAGTEYCLRQWLANRLAARPATLMQLRGNIVHGCFEALCRDGTLGADAVQSMIAGSTFGLALLGATSDQLLEAVTPHLERLTSWRASHGDLLFGDTSAAPCYESALLCPELGLRGRVDLAMRRVIHGGPPMVTRVVELKTAKYNEKWPDPEFQVRGYYAILSSQQRLAPDFQARVLYTGSAEVAYRPVACGPEHIEHVVSNRNRAILALLLGHAPPSTSINRCKMSSSRADCVRLSALLGLDPCHGRDLSDLAAGGGGATDADFYAAQYRLLRLEARATSHELAALWRVPIAERESAGAAIRVLEEIERGIDLDGRARYRFRCRNHSELRQGDTILLSDGDPVRGEVTVATLLEATADVVEVLAMEPMARPALIDRYNSGEAQDRTVRALHAWLHAPRETRSLVYAARPPELNPPHRAASAEYSCDLNSRQIEALDLALCARDYLLVQGPPGTGKTHLIARMVQALVARGERVIVSAWTNQAVDTMLYALLAQGFDQFARLGQPRAMDPALARYAVTADISDPSRQSATPRHSPQDVARLLGEVPVLAGTVSALADARITNAIVRRDVVILDEAAQLSLAASVGALRLARRFVLVGDDQQLPPVVRSDEAAREGLSLSPFAHLRPEAQANGAFVRLSEQFRMHEAIAAWPSEAFYAGDLHAHPTVRFRQLPPASTPISDPITARETPIVLVDAGADAMREATFAARAVQALVSSGVRATDIGVVAPFRATVAAVRRLLDADPDTTGCTIDTVDRFQGGQREAIVVCLGLHGIGRRGHAFVDDPRRLNVAFTRARAKLIVIGDLARAGTLPTLAGFVHHCVDHGMPVLTANLPAAV